MFWTFLDPGIGRVIQLSHPHSKGPGGAISIEEIECPLGTTGQTLQRASDRAGNKLLMHVSHHTAGHHKSREEEIVWWYFKAKAENLPPNSMFGSVLTITHKNSFKLNILNLQPPTSGIIQAIMSKPIYRLPGEQYIKRHPVWAEDYGWVNHSAREWAIQRFLKPQFAMQQ